LQIGDNAIADTSKLLGVTETDPIDFYVYADQNKFYDALGPGAHRIGELLVGSTVDVAFRLERDAWNGESRLQARLADFRA